MKAILQIMSRMLKKYQLKEYHTRMDDLFRRGLIIGKNVTIQRCAYIDEFFPYLISIGNNCTLADYTRILAHDESICKYTGGYIKIGKVTIQDNCFIAAGSIIMPGISIGPNALVTAGSLIINDVPPNSCVAGVPARLYGRFDDFIEKHKKRLKELTVFDYAEINPGYFSKEISDIVKGAISNGDAYVRGFVGRYPYSHKKD